MSSSVPFVPGYVVGPSIGHGSFGSVRLCHPVGIPSPSPIDLVAIKFVDKNSIFSLHDVERVYRETFILTTLKHNNIIKLFSVVDSKDHISLVMEYAAGGDLSSYVSSFPLQRIDEFECRKLFIQIIEGVEFCHRHQILHRDLKLSNLLMDEKKTTVKIADFGLSNSIKFGSKMSTHCGTPAYYPPENIKKKSTKTKKKNIIHHNKEKYNNHNDHSHVTAHPHTNTNTNSMNANVSNDSHFHSPDAPFDAERKLHKFHFSADDEEKGTEESDEEDEKHQREQDSDNDTENDHMENESQSHRDIDGNGNGKRTTFSSSPPSPSHFPSSSHSQHPSPSSFSLSSPPTFNSPVDLWSCGIILFTLLSGFLPFDSSSLPHLFRKIRQRQFQPPEYLSHEAKDLIDRLLTINPMERCTLSEIRAHPWLASEYEKQLLPILSALPVVTKEMISAAKQYNFYTTETRIDERVNHPNKIIKSFIHKEEEEEAEGIKGTEKKKRAKKKALSNHSSSSAYSSSSSSSSESLTSPLSSSSSSLSSTYDVDQFLMAQVRQRLGIDNTVAITTAVAVTHNDHLPTDRTHSSPSPSLTSRIRLSEPSISSGTPSSIGTVTPTVPTTTISASHGNGNNKNIDNILTHNSLPENFTFSPWETNPKREKEKEKETKGENTRGTIGDAGGSPISSDSPCSSPSSSSRSTSYSPSTSLLPLPSSLSSSLLSPKRDRAHSFSVTSSSLSSLSAKQSESQRTSSVALALALASGTVHVDSSPSFSPSSFSSSSSPPLTISFDRNQMNFSKHRTSLSSLPVSNPHGTQTQTGSHSLPQLKLPKLSVVNSSNSLVSPKGIMENANHSDSMRDAETNTQTQRQSHITHPHTSQLSLTPSVLSTQTNTNRLPSLKNIPSNQNNNNSHQFDALPLSPSPSPSLAQTFSSKRRSSASAASPMSSTSPSPNFMSSTSSSKQKTNYLIKSSAPINNYLNF